MKIKMERREIIDSKGIKWVEHWDIHDTLHPIMLMRLKVTPPPPSTEKLEEIRDQELDEYLNRMGI